MKVKKINLKLFAIIITFVLIIIMPLSKYALYELSGAAPKLRESIGQKVILPQQKYSINWTTHIIKPYEGELKSVAYRWNYDHIGFFDLSVEVDGCSMGLSPFEAMNVKIESSIDSTFEKSKNK